MKLLVLPYKSYSQSAKALAKSLGLKFKKLNTPVKKGMCVLNWGNSRPNFTVGNNMFLNRPASVLVASDKLNTFKYLKDGNVNIPEFTTDIEVAKGWIKKKRIVFCRKLLRANSGRGIVIAKTEDQLAQAPLYVKYIRKEHEYRVHVFKDKVIDVVEKKRRKGFKEATDYNKYVRSYEQGWVFTRQGVQVSDAVKDEAIKACKALGLDFGAVDVILDQEDKPVILEINTAPGLQGTTLERYKKALQEFVKTL